MFDRVVRVNDNGVPLAQTSDYLSDQCALFPHVRRARIGSACFHSKNFPSFPLVEQGAVGNLQYILCLPDDKTGLDTIGVTQT